MYNELIIKTNSKEHKILLQAGFYPSTASAVRYHKHNYAEIHVIAGGKATFSIDEALHTLESGSIMIIPKGIFHCFESSDDNTFHGAFQIDYNTPEMSVYNVGEATVLSFLQETENSRHTGDCSKVAAYIALFCSYFCHDETLHTSPVTDYGFLIHEFLSTHYSNDLRLSDLADFLHLSERQTERLVIEHTGNSFRDELTAIRLNVAKKLLRSSDKSLAEIAEYVGYKSYTGFWKAMKKYNIQS